MKKLSIKDILIDPNATLNTGKLDFSDLEVINILENSKQQQEKILSSKNISKRELEKEITI